MESEHVEARPSDRPGEVGPAVTRTRAWSADCRHDVTGMWADSLDSYVEEKFGDRDVYVERRDGRTYLVAAD